MLLAVHYRVMEHLGSLESTQEARVALGYASGNCYSPFVLYRFLRALEQNRAQSRLLYLLITRASFCQNCILPSDSEANRDGADAEFPLFFSSSASFKL